MSYLVYLAGPIKGLEAGQCHNWRDIAQDSLGPEIEVLSPLRNKGLRYHEGPIDSSKIQSLLTTDKIITRRDRNDIKRCDAVLFNLLDAKTVSKGTMIEFGWASAYDKPIVVVMEFEGNPHEYIMIDDLAWCRIDNLVQDIHTIKHILLHGV